MLTEGTTQAPREHRGGFFSNVGVGEASDYSSESRAARLPPSLPLGPLLGLCLQRLTVRARDSPQQSAATQRPCTGERRAGERRAGEQ